MKLIAVLVVITIPCTLCILDKQLNDECSSTADCAVAYSACTEIKTGAGISVEACKCRPGFKEEKNLCTPPTKQCPTWECPADAKCYSGPGKACEYSFDPNTRKETDSCPKDEFCFVYPNVMGELGHSSVGHCCMKPQSYAKNIKLGCPFKNEDTKGTCPKWDPNQPADALQKNPRTCSFETHDCINHFDKGACCPLPCHGASSHFSVNGKCYDHVLDGQDCTYDAQCNDSSRCMKGFCVPYPH